MSLRLLRAPLAPRTLGLALAARPALRAPAPAMIRAYAKLDGGDPGTGRWETRLNDQATESEAVVRAEIDMRGRRGGPTPAMQEATAEEAERRYAARLMAKMKDSYQKALKGIKASLK